MYRKRSTKARIWMSITGAVLTLAFSSCTSAQPPVSSDPGASTAIKRVLEKWPRDFAARDAAAVCGLFAPDALIIYQDAPDRNHQALCAQLTRVLQDAERSYLYDAPDIKEIIVSGDLATVRLIWTLRVRRQGETEEAVERENGLDVFKRQPDGTWKIYISHAFPEPPLDGSK